MAQKEIFFITSNQSKLAEANNIAKDYNVKIVGKEIKLPELMIPSEEEIIIEKANYAFEKIKKPLIVDDAGIYFEAYQNFPGAFTKFIIKFLSFDGIFKLLEGKNRKAYFQCIIGFMDKNLDQPLLFKGICRGKIAEKVSEVFDPNFEFNSIFIPEGETRTLSEIPIEGRKKYSHRIRALEKFLRWYISNHIV